MMIYSMTATFGKLEHETLSLESGLNIIQAPNEWGKSTWCAFLAAMLYGLETRAHSTKTALADKERFAPWSGSPMAGRVDLHWEGRDITIERRTKGRSIFGDFKAYETESGLPLPELTAQNCGEMLLGVERSVFLRAGFLRLADLPVTQDETLRRRLNALVTTGDESGAGDDLAKKLKDIKNRCRFNRTGLLPQAEAQRDALTKNLDELSSLETQCQRLQQRQADLEDRTAKLENHRDALHYAAAEADAARVDQARTALGHAEERLAAMEDSCRSLPPRQEAEQAAQALQELRVGLASLQMEGQMLPQAPAQPAPPSVFHGLSPTEALAQAEADTTEYRTLDTETKKRSPWLWILGAVLALGGAGLLIARLWVGAVPLGAGIILTAESLLIHTKKNREAARRRAALDALTRRYGDSAPDSWIGIAAAYRDSMTAYTQAQTQYQAARGDLDQRAAALLQKTADFTHGESLEVCRNRCEAVLAAWDAWGDAWREHQRLQSHAQALEAMAKTAKPPKFPDAMDYSEAETARLLSDAAVEQRQLQLQLGQCLGQMAKAGQKEALEAQLAAVDQRIARLEETYAAVALALDTLTAATGELQRRFAPRISKRAQSLFGKLTGERYDRLTLGEDLSLQACAAGEDILRSSLWRSDGTVDQLYLALRLAVAAELTPNAPLVLDDALVRFDDTRLAAAMNILREEAQHKQVILFTCQTRERNA